MTAPNVRESSAQAELNLALERYPARVPGSALARPPARRCAVSPAWLPASRHRVTVMAKPVLVIVDDEEASRQELARELESRYGRHYRIVVSLSPELALAQLREFRAEGVAMPLVLADQWMPGMTGAEFLAQVREVMPTARRGLMISWFDRADAEPVLEALAARQMDFYLPKPVWSPDEQFPAKLAPPSPAMPG